MKLLKVRMLIFTDLPLMPGRNLQIEPMRLDYPAENSGRGVAGVQNKLRIIRKKEEGIMNSVKILLSGMLLSCFAFGCCAAGKCDGECPVQTGDVKTAPRAVNAVKKAVTPDGDVLLIITEWDTEAVCPEKNKAPQKAKCWQTVDGKTYCAKPLKSVTAAAAEPGSELYTAPDGSLKAVDESSGAGKSGKRTEWCVKEVKPCAAVCGDSAPKTECVTMKDGSKGVAKADQKESRKLSDEVEDDEYFIVVTD